MARTIAAYGLPDYITVIDIRMIVGSELVDIGIDDASPFITAIRPDTEGLEPHEIDTEMRRFALLVNSSALPEGNIKYLGHFKRHDGGILHVVEMEIVNKKE